MPMHSILLIGQSNMAGRGVIGSVPAIANDRIFVLRNARWQPMFVPVNPDRPFSGINLAESFADAYCREHNCDIGIIPCADGGTSLDQWAEGGLLYDHALAIARLAMRTSTLRAVLWHQGESDCYPGLAESYRGRLTAMLRALRRDLGMPDIPVLLGALGDYLADYDEQAKKYYPVVNRALQSVAESEENMAFVSASGLGSKPDNLHFDAPALREFGLRYYEAYRTVETPLGDESTVSGDDGRIKSEIEKL